MLSGMAAALARWIPRSNAFGITNPRAVSATSVMWSVLLSIRIDALLVNVMRIVVSS
jgi:hypothetical protein